MNAIIGNALLQMEKTYIFATLMTFCSTEAVILYKHIRMQERKSVIFLIHIL